MVAGERAVVDARPFGRLRGRFARFPEAGMLTAVIVTALIFSLLDPRFASVRNVANIASQISFLAVLAVSMTYVIICGEIDLSIGSMVGLSGVMFGLLATVVQIDPIWVYFNVSETIVLRVKEALAKQGKTLRDVPEIAVEIGLQTETGYPHKGKLDYIAPEVDPSTGTL